MILCFPHTTINITDDAHKASLSFPPQDETVLPTQTSVPRHQTGPTYPPPPFLCLAEDVWRVKHGLVAMARMGRVRDSATAVVPGNLSSGCRPECQNVSLSVISTT